MGQGQLGSVLRAFSAAGMGRLFAPCGIPGRDSSPDDLWLLAAAWKMLLNQSTGSTATARGVCGSWVGTERRWSQPAGRDTPAEGGSVTPGTGVLKESWV